MKREEVYKVFDTEREYQELQTANPNRPDMVDDLHLGDTLTAIRHNLSKAESEWYFEAEPYANSMAYLRKVAGLIVKAAERYGIPERINER